MYFSEIDKIEYAVKPMNCPGGCLVYNSRQHSYREFPMRIAELGLVHRHEASGVMHGLFRVRQFTQDDAHIFVPRTDRIWGSSVINLVFEIYKTFGFEDVHIELSTNRKITLAQMRYGKFQLRFSRRLWGQKISIIRLTRAKVRSTDQR